MTPQTKSLCAAMSQAAALCFYAVGTAQHPALMTSYEAAKRKYEAACAAAGIAAYATYDVD